MKNKKNSTKLIRLVSTVILLIFSPELFSAVFYVKNSPDSPADEVTCLEPLEGRFSYCVGQKYEGVVDYKPQEPGLKFLPFFFAGDAIVLDLQIELAENQCTYLFKKYNFIGLDRYEYDHALKNLISHKIASTIFKFIGHLRIYERRNRIKNSAFNNYLVFNNGHLNSYFLPDISRKKGEIILDGKEKFSSSQTEFYNAFVQVTGKIITLPEAQQFLDEILLMEDLPYNYTSNGCFTRAHIIANYLHKKGAQTGKVWLKGNLIDPYSKTEWTYHVAATLQVKIRDSSVSYVIDPSPINKKLLTINEWKNLISGDIEAIEVAPPFPVHSSIFMPLLITYTSHLSLFPYGMDMNMEYEDSLEFARLYNAKHMAKLKKITQTQEPQ
jgi:hypothetical protein